MKYTDWSIVFKEITIILSNLSNSDIRRTSFNNGFQSLKSVNDITYTYSCLFDITPETISNKQVVFGGPAHHQHGGIATISSRVGAPLGTHMVNYNSGTVEISFDIHGIRTISVSHNSNTLISSNTSYNNRDFFLYCNEKGFYVNNDFYLYSDTDVMFNIDVLDDTKISLIDICENIISLSKITKEWCTE